MTRVWYNKCIQKTPLKTTYCNFPVAQLWKRLTIIDPQISRFSLKVIIIIVIHPTSNCGKLTHVVLT